MPYNETGLDTGKRDIEYHGESRVVITEVEITDYESGGVPFEPIDFGGVSREGIVTVDVADASSYEAQFDYANRAIVIRNLSDGSEVADATTLNVPVRVRIQGRG
jgi:hypothetical protein